MKTAQNSDVTTTKFFAARDSATALLRKMGVPSTHYDKFIKKTSDQLEVNVTEAEAFMIGSSDTAKPVPKDKPAPKVKPAAKTKAVKAKPQAAKADGKKVRKAPPHTPVKAKKGPQTSPKAKPVKSDKPASTKAPTVSSVARAMILSGKTNEEVWKKIQSQFSLDDSKKSYPAWYRSDCKRRGEIQ